MKDKRAGAKMLKLYNEFLISCFKFHHQDLHTRLDNLETKLSEIKSSGASSSGTLPTHCNLNTLRDVLITPTETGLVFEWWSADKKLTIYLDTSERFSVWGLKTYKSLSTDSGVNQEEIELTENCRELLNLVGWLDD